MKRSLPLLVSIISFFTLSALLYFYIRFLNFFSVQKILLSVRPADMLVGLTIYLKTSIDFVIFIGNLMHKHPGVKNRIAIELGTSLGNALGTLIILTIWIFFKEVPVLLVVMMIIASLLLLKMAFDPLLKKRHPKEKTKEVRFVSFLPLFLFALTIPFLLGLDDFAGYIPLFSIINLIGFSIGVFLGHMILTSSLFAFPKKTTQFIRLPFMQVAGSVIFTGLALWGFVEAGQIIFEKIL